MEDNELKEKTVERYGKTIISMNEIIKVTKRSEKYTSKQSEKTTPETTTKNEKATELKRNKNKRKCVFEDKGKCKEKYTSCNLFHPKSTCSQ